MSMVNLDITIRRGDEPGDALPVGTSAKYTTLITSQPQSTSWYRLTVDGYTKTFTEDELQRDESGALLVPASVIEAMAAVAKARQALSKTTHSTEQSGQDTSNRGSSSGLNLSGPGFP